MPELQCRFAKQSFDSFPKSSTGLWEAGTGDEHGNVGAVQNAASQIAHNIVTKQTACLGCAGHNQVIIAVADFFEHLIAHEPVPEMHFSRHAEPVEFSFLTAQIGPKL